VLSALLRQSGLTVAVAETSFGSSIIQTVKSMEGSRDFFRLGLTLADPAQAQKILNLPGGIAAEKDLFGAEAARLLAEGVRKFSGADLGLGLTGRVGKEKGQDHLIYIALAHAGKTETMEQRWPLAMRFIENRMTKMALSQVRRYLLALQGSKKNEKG
jgi:nicotinamide-nucleotide amidase